MLRPDIIFRKNKTSHLLSFKGGLFGKLPSGFMNNSTVLSKKCYVVKLKPCHSILMKNIFFFLLHIVENCFTLVSLIIVHMFLVIRLVLPVINEWMYFPF